MILIITHYGRSASSDNVAILKIRDEKEVSVYRQTSAVVKYIGDASQGFDPWASQVGHSGANRLLPLRCFFRAVLPTANSARIMNIWFSFLVESSVTVCK